MGPGGEAPRTVNGGREREGRCRGWNPRGRDGTGNEGRDGGAEGMRRGEERGAGGAEGRVSLRRDNGREVKGLLWED